jgi:hypothetical protein
MVTATIAVRFLSHLWNVEIRYNNTNGYNYLAEKDANGNAVGRVFTPNGVEMELVSTIRQRIINLAHIQAGCTNVCYNVDARTFARFDYDAYCDRNDKGSNYDRPSEYKVGDVVFINETNGDEDDSCVGVVLGVIDVEGGELRTEMRGMVAFSNLEPYNPKKHAGAHMTPTLKYVLDNIGEKSLYPGYLLKKVDGDVFEYQNLSTKKHYFDIGTGKMIPMRDGKIVHTKIKQKNGYTIKFNTNGVYGFSVWRGKTCLEDGFNTMVAVEEYVTDLPN